MPESSIEKRSATAVWTRIRMSVPPRDRWRVARTPRRFSTGWLLALLIVLASDATPVVAQRIAFRDVSGRDVVLDGPARRIAIDDGRYLIALSLLLPDPVSVLAGWPHDVNRIGDQTYERYVAKFPAIARIARVSSSAGDFSLEQTLAARPEVAIFSLGQGPTPDQVQRIERAGIKVVFIDFFTRPFENLEPSLEILGRVVGQAGRANAFIEFRQSRMTRIAETLRTSSGTAPTVFFEAHAGISADCCNSPGRGNIGDYITFAGGRNIGADVLPGAIGKLSLEYILSRDPTVYIATGGPHLERTGGLVIGPGYTEARARAALTSMTGRRGIAQLTAVRRGRVHGLSHQLLNSPLDILAVEALAKWIRPELFADLSPEATMAEINERFLAVPLEGAHWVDLR